MINLNSNNYSFLSPDVATAMQRAAKICEQHNPIGLGSDNEINALIENARNQVAGFLNTDPQMLFFNGSQQQNGLALILSIIHLLKINVVITTASENSQKLDLLKELEQNEIIELKLIETDQFGSLDKMQLTKLLQTENHKKLVTLSHANKITGELLPVKEIRNICKANDVFFHLNTNLTIGRYAIDFSALSPDFMSFGCNLEHGPEGIGVVIVNREMKVNDKVFNLLYKYLAANENNSLPLILGLERALGMAVDIVQLYKGTLSKTREYLISQLNQKLSIVPINDGKEKDGLINLVPIVVSSLTFGKHLAEKLDMKGISIECIDYSELNTQQTNNLFIPIALNDEITEKEIDYFIECLEQIRNKT